MPPLARAHLRPSVLLAPLLLGHSLLHFGLALVIGLTPDEALHALSALHPDWSYLDHPPLIGWLQWPLVALGASEGWLRLLPQIFWVLSAGLIYDVARRLHRLLVPAFVTADAAGWWAVLAYSLAPLLHLLGIGLLPDSLLMLCTAALLWQSLRLLDVYVVQRRAEWLLLGVIVGLAGLSQYTALLVVLPALAALFSRHGAALLRHSGPWLAALLALLLVAPVLAWNMQHDWVALRQPLQALITSPWEPGRLLMFLLAQALLYPLLLLGLFGLRHGVLGGLELDRSLAWLLAMCALPLAVLALLAGSNTSLTLWTAPAWAVLAPFAGLGLAALWASGRRTLIWQLGAWQAVAIALLYLLMLLAGPPWLASEEPDRSNAFSELYGWQEAGLRAQQLAREHSIPRLAVQHRSLATRLAWYARPLPVYVLAPDANQIALWNGLLRRHYSAIVLDWSQQAYELPVGEGLFERCELGDSWDVQHAGRVVSRFRLYRCYGWGGQPAPRRLDAS
ncbi:MAG: glycosyltransferase family 39 protein [Curvibacter sp.]|jgi:4-amino-4-deoxy-L-arabinose transferase-like glycosyltransferase